MGARKAAVAREAGHAQRVQRDGLLILILIFCFLFWIQEGW